MRPLLFGLLLATAPAAAQTLSLTPAPTDGSAQTVTVSGYGEAEAPADYAVVRFQVTTEGATVDEAQTLHAVEVARVEGLLRAAGVPEGRVVVDRLSLSGSENDYGERSDDAGAVSLSRAVTIEVDDLDAVVGLVAGLASDVGDDALAVQDRSVTVGFRRRDVTALREGALRDAVRDARRRADLVAEAAGVRVGRVLSVTEAGVTGTLFGGGPGSDRVLAAMTEEMGGASGARIESTRVIVVYTVE